MSLDDQSFHYASEDEYNPLETLRYIEKFPSGNLKSERWIRGKYYHRDGDLPSVIEYYPNGLKKTELWYINGKKHSKYRPSILTYYDDGNIQSERWYFLSQPHRLDGPAHIEYYKDGTVSTRLWYNHGQLSALYGTACENYYRNDGSIKQEFYTHYPLPNWHIEVKYNRQGNVTTKKWQYIPEHVGIETDEMNTWLKTHKITWPFSKDDLVLLKLQFG